MIRGASPPSVDRHRDVPTVSAHLVFAYIGYNEGMDEVPVVLGPGDLLANEDETLTLTDYTTYGVEFYEDGDADIIWFSSPGQMYRQRIDDERNGNG